MKYPNGVPIMVGDVIWWNEGKAKGIVGLILDSKESFEFLSLAVPGKESIEQLEKFGPSEYGIMICANSDGDYISCDVFCPESDFEDEGICLISRAKSEETHLPPIE